MKIDFYTLTIKNDTIKLLFVQKFYFLYQAVFAKSNAIRLVNRRFEKVG